MDYARGGGSSGAGVSEGGAIAANLTVVLPVALNRSIRTAVDATAAGPHGTIDWHPSGAHGNRQGEDGGVVVLVVPCCTSAAAGCSFICIPDIEPFAAESHAKPLVTRTRAACNRLDRSRAAGEGERGHHDFRARSNSYRPLHSITAKARFSRDGNASLHRATMH